MKKIRPINISPQQKLHPGQATKNKQPRKKFHTLERRKIRLSNKCTNQTFLKQGTPNVMRQQKLHPRKTRIKIVE